VGVPEQGFWEEVLNTDADIYGGGNRGNLGGGMSEGIATDGHAQSIALTLPPLSVVVMRLREST
jgi:1,4-alpha-glucan branching enzyme